MPRRLGWSRRAGSWLFAASCAVLVPVLATASTMSIAGIAAPHAGSAAPSAPPASAASASISAAPAFASAALAPATSGQDLRLLAELGGRYGQTAPFGELVLVSVHSRVLAIDPASGERGAIVAVSPPLGPRIDTLVAGGGLIVVAGESLQVLEHEGGELVVKGSVRLHAPARLAAMTGDVVWLVDGASRVARVSLADPGRPSFLAPWIPEPPESDFTLSSLTALVAAPRLDRPEGDDEERLLVMAGWSRGPRLPGVLELMEVDATQPNSPPIARLPLPTQLAQLLTVDGEIAVVVGRGGMVTAVKRTADALLLFGNMEFDVRSDLRAATLVDSMLWILADGVVHRRDLDARRDVHPPVSFAEAATNLAATGRQLLVAGETSLTWLDGDGQTREGPPNMDVRTRPWPLRDVAAMGNPPGLWLLDEAGELATLVADAPPRSVQVEESFLGGLRDIVVSQNGRMFGLSPWAVLALTGGADAPLAVQDQWSFDASGGHQPVLLAATDEAAFLSDGQGQSHAWWPSDGTRGAVSRPVARGVRALSASLDGDVLWLRLQPPALRSLLLGDHVAEPGALIAAPGLTSRQASVRGGIAAMGAGGLLTLLDLRNPNRPITRDGIDMPGTVREIARSDTSLWTHWQGPTSAGLQRFDLPDAVSLSPGESAPLALSNGASVLTTVGDEAWLLFDGVLQRYAPPETTPGADGPTRPPPTPRASATPEPTGTASPVPSPIGTRGTPAAPSSDAAPLVLPWLGRAVRDSQRF